MVFDQSERAQGPIYIINRVKGDDYNNVPPASPFSRTYPFGSCSYQVLLMSNPLSSSSVYGFCCSRINFQNSCVFLIY